MISSPIKNGYKFLGRMFSGPAVKPKVKQDPIQEAALKENCLLIDENDKVIGTASKRECHLVKPDGSIPLHRGFSVYIFNPRGDLLLHKRSPMKITYPERYTNTCCSHPITDIAGEDEEKDAIGIKRAAQRRLNYELGISINDAPLDKLKYITRIHYCDTGDGQWGEHEIAYILFLLADVKVKPNPNEISEISYIPFEHMNTFVPTLGASLTPWFQLILKYKLCSWWKNLDTIDSFVDHKTIHKLKNT